MPSFSETKISIQLTIRDARRPRSVLVVMLALILCSFFVLEACAPDVSGSSVEPGSGAKTDNRRTGEAPVMTSAAKAPLPLDPYLFTVAQYDAISEAREHGIQECMLRFGFAYEPVLSGTEWLDYGSNSDLRMAGHYGPQSMDHAKRWGFHPVGGYRATEPKGSSIGSESQAYLSAMGGGTKASGAFGPGGMTINGLQVPEFGCVGDAFDAITGIRRPDSMGDSKIAIRIKDEALSAVLQDPRVVGVFRKWSDCMVAAGNDRYRTPLDVIEDPRWKASSMPSTEEISAAVDDQICRESENVVGVWYSADYEHEAKLIAANSDEMKRARSRVETIHSRAIKIVRGRS